jgi:hypothetical protein
MNPPQPPQGAPSPPTPRATASDLVAWFALPLMLIGGARLALGREWVVRLLLVEVVFSVDWAAALPVMIFVWSQQIPAAGTPVRAVWAVPLVIASATHNVVRYSPRGIRRPSPITLGHLVGVLVVLLFM